MSESKHAEPTRQAARKVREGVVVSDKMDKTVVVAVEQRVKHPLYGKVMTKTERLKAHDEANDAGVGDRVRELFCCHDRADTRPARRKTPRCVCSQLVGGVRGSPGCAWR